MRPVSDVACHKLAELVARYGRDLGDDPRRCEALLRDVCGQQYKREIFVLVSAARERVPAQLQQSSSGIPAEVVLTRLIQHLHDNLGLSEDLARWAVECWAFALQTAGYGDTKPRPVGSLGTAGSDYSRAAIGLSAAKHDLFAEFPRVSSEEVLRQTIRGVLADGIVTNEERAEVEKLRRDLGIAPEAAAQLLAAVAAELQSRPGAGSRDSAGNATAAPSAAAPASPSPRPSGATSKLRATPRSLIRPSLILFVLLAALSARWMFGSGRSHGPTAFESTGAKTDSEPVPSPRVPVPEAAQDKNSETPAVLGDQAHARSSTRAERSTEPAPARPSVESTEIQGRLQRDGTFVLLVTSEGQTYPLGRAENEQAMSQLLAICPLGSVCQITVVVQRGSVTRIDSARLVEAAATAPPDPVASASAGLGILLRSVDDQVVVGGVLAGGPADRHGELSVGDIIVAAGESGSELTYLKGRSPAVVRNIFRGSAGVVVKLLVQKANDPDGRTTRTLTIPREELPALAEGEPPPQPPSHATAPELDVAHAMPAKPAASAVLEREQRVTTAPQPAPQPKAVPKAGAPSSAEADATFDSTRARAEQGNAAAQSDLGMMYDEGQGVRQDYAEAVKWYRRAAEQGVVDAQTNLGLMYDEGRGVRQDYAEAVKWYSKAAEQGDAEAQIAIGDAYDEGRGVRQDYAEAVKWYRKAAEQGFADAQDHLGVRYAIGKGVGQDYVQAYKWWSLAVAQGLENAKRNLDLLTPRLTPAQITEGQELAREWQPTPETATRRSFAVVGDEGGAGTKREEGSEELPTADEAVGITEENFVVRVKQLIEEYGVAEIGEGKPGKVYDEKILVRGEKQGFGIGLAESLNVPGFSNTSIFCEQYNRNFPDGTKAEFSIEGWWLGTLPVDTTSLVVNASRCVLNEKSTPSTVSKKASVETVLTLTGVVRFDESGRLRIHDDGGQTYQLTPTEFDLSIRKEVFQVCTPAVQRCVMTVAVEGERVTRIIAMEKTPS